MARPANETVLLRLREVSKNYDGVRALRQASVAVREGEVHAIVGENGAGKSTLIKIIAGAIDASGGTMEWMGEPVSPTIHEAQRLGIRVIHQHLSLVDHLSVQDNLVLGREEHRVGFVRTREAKKRTADALRRLGAEIDPDVAVGQLPVAQKQLVEIARAISTDVRLLIMDEPTASLGIEESEHLFAVIRDLRADGVAIIYVSHYLDEVLELADRVTVLRDGTSGETQAASKLTKPDLISQMVGRELDVAAARESAATERVVLDVRGLTTATGLSDVSFKLHAGEILGVYGLLGSGRTELLRALFGADRPLSGSIELDGTRLQLRAPFQARRRGVGFVPEERTRDGIFAPLSVRENILSANPEAFSKWGWIQPSTERRLAREAVAAMGVKMSSPEAPISSLSGGNQQKTILGRWLMQDIKVLLLDDPTVGVDVGARAEIYRLLAAKAAEGTAVIFVSSDLPEALAMADRMLVLRNGRLVGECTAQEVDQEHVLNLALVGER